MMYKLARRACMSIARMERDYLVRKRWIAKIQGVEKRLKLYGARKLVMTPTKGI